MRRSSSVNPVHFALENVSSPQVNAAEFELDRLRHRPLKSPAVEPSQAHYMPVIS